MRVLPRILNHLLRVPYSGLGPPFALSEGPVLSAVTPAAVDSQSRSALVPL